MSDILNKTIVLECLASLQHDPNRPEGVLKSTRKLKGRRGYAAGIWWRRRGARSSKGKLFVTCLSRSPWQASGSARVPRCEWDLSPFDAFAF